MGDRGSRSSAPVKANDVYAREKISSVNRNIVYHFFLL